LLATALLLALPTAANARPEPSSVARSVDVGPNGRSLTLRCARARIALGGAVIAISPEVTTRASVPSGARGWTFRFAGGPGRARVVLRCVRVRPSGGLRSTEIRGATRLFNGNVRPRSSLGATLRCPSGFVPTGYGLQQGGSGTVTLATARPGRRAWRFRLDNEGDAGASPTVFARCLARAAIGRGPGGAARHPLIVRVAGFRDRVGGGSRNDVTHRCPAGHFSAGAGHSMSASDDIVASRAFTFRVRGGRWTFANPDGGAERVSTYLTCLSLRTGFR